ncbi:hypothetical protein P7C70_g6370, partial [Phenoliferia sp. Uapishka_3]
MSSGRGSDSLHPSSSSSTNQSNNAALRISTPSTIGGIFDSYGPSSPSHSARSSISSEAVGVTTATQVRRNSSPSPVNNHPSSTSSRTTGAIISPTDEPGGGGLHRRNSSTVRHPPEGTRAARGSSAGSGSDDGMGLGLGLGVGGDSTRRRAELGWGGHASPSPASPVRARDGQPRPTRQTAFNSNSSQQLQMDGQNDPLSSYILHDPSSSSSYQTARSLGSDPFLVDPTTAAGSYSHSLNDHQQQPAPRLSQDSLRTISDLDDNDDDVDPQEGDDDPEPTQYTSLSPLQPSTGSPIISSSSNSRPRRSFQFQTSTPRSRQPSSDLSRSQSVGLSPNLSRSSRGGSGSPGGASPGGGGGGGGLGRRKTLTVAATDGIRRMSLRVVNMNGSDTGALARDTVAAGPVNGPVEREHPFGRMNDQEDGRVPEEEDLPPEMPLEEIVVMDLRGRTLGIFGPENWEFDELTRLPLAERRLTEPAILLCIILSVIIMTIQTAPNVYLHARPTKGYFHHWTDYALFVLFVIFSAELLARIIVTGLFLNPPMPISSPTIPTKEAEPTTLVDSTDNTNPTSYPPPNDLSYSSHNFQTLRDFSSTTSLVDKKNVAPISGHAIEATGFSFQTTNTDYSSKSRTPFVQSIRRQRTTYQQAFLRHSWNRLDFVAVVGFWISFVLSMSGVEAGNNVYIFRALSVLRATRLLAITAGTTTILNSLKGAAPQLVKVAFFVAFAMVMFSIIGVQSFKGSYKRACQWTDTTGQYGNVTTSQICGGFIDSLTGKALGYIQKSNGQPSSEGAKGFVCPPPSVCVRSFPLALTLKESENPINGVFSFDNIFAALLQVVIVASANTWTTIMYDMMDADFFVSCLYFIVCLIVLNYWLINMFVAVITNTFGSIMDTTQHSAFASSTIITPSTVSGLKSAFTTRPRMNQGPELVRKAYKATHLFWIAAIIADIGIQASRTFNMTSNQIFALDRIELWFTVAFDVELIVRAFASLPDWRTMKEPANAADYPEVLSSYFGDTENEEAVGE